MTFQIASPLRDTKSTAAEVERRRQLLSPTEFPHLFEVLPYAAECDWDKAFVYGLDTILQGLEKRLS